MARYDFFNLRALPKPAEIELTARHDAEILQLLPALGPLFGLCILAFSAWDFLIDPAHAVAALAARSWLVLAGSLAYVTTRLPWTPMQRCGYIYATYAGAIVICEFLLKNGFLYGLTGIAACVFAVTVVTLRVRTFFLILSVPSMLFIALSAIRLPLLEFFNGLMLYFFSVGLAFVVMLVTRSFHQRAFLLEKELLEISRHDSLTGIYSRGYLAELAKREIALATRHGRTLALAMLDIDHFKNVNDTYGHDIGDKVIKSLADTCKANLRSIDHFGRFGGEEFVCIFPETGEEQAMFCAERLRQSIEAARVDTPQGQLRYTASIGVAILNQRHADLDALLKDADRALYRAKRDGRNRVILAGTE